MTHFRLHGYFYLGDLNSGIFLIIGFNLYPKVLRFSINLVPDFRGFYDLQVWLELCLPWIVCLNLSLTCID